MKKFALLGVLLLAVIGLGAQDLSPEAVDREYETLTAEVNEHIKTGNNAAAIPLLEKMHELKPNELVPVEYLGIMYINLPEDRPGFTNALPWLLEAERRYSENTSIYIGNKDFDLTRAAMPPACGIA